MAQLRLTTNPPDSVKRFTVKKSIIGQFDSASAQNNNGQNPPVILGNAAINQHQASGGGNFHSFKTIDDSQS